MLTTTDVVCVLQGLGVPGHQVLHISCTVFSRRLLLLCLYFVERRHTRWSGRGHWDHCSHMSKIHATTLCGKGACVVHKREA